MGNNSIGVVLRDGRLEPRVDADISTAIAMLAVLAKEIARKGGITTEEVFQIAKKGMESVK